MLKTLDLFDLTHTIAAELLSGCTYPWEAIPRIRETILALGPTLGEEYRELRPQIWVHATAEIDDNVYIGAPCIIGPRSAVRHCAYVRESALIGADCVVGNSVELKNVILFDGVQVPHYNYVGDSVLGYKAHFGAGALTSNLKSDKSLVTVRDGDEKLPTGLKKMGAIVGDLAEVGCNSVLNPGTIVGPRSNIYPLSCVRGTVPPDSILKTGGVIVAKEG